MFLFVCQNGPTNTLPLFTEHHASQGTYIHTCRYVYVYSCSLSTTTSKHSQQGLIEIYYIGTHHTCKYIKAPNLMEILVQFYPFPGCFLGSRKFHIQVFSLKLKVFVNYQSDVNLKTQSSPKAGSAAAIIGSQ